MPIRPENRKRYPKDWPAISTAIKNRANNCCEHCGIRQYSVVYWEDGRYHRLAGNGPCDAAGLGGVWPSYAPISYREACEFRNSANEWREPFDPKFIVIVLTVAHLDHHPENCDPANLKALCQRCHLRYDQQHHARSAYRRRKTEVRTLDLFANA